MTYFTLYSYNFCWPVRTLRVKGEDGRWQRRTPALVLGLETNDNGHLSTRHRDDGRCSRSLSLTIVIDEGDTLWLGWRESQATDLASPGDAALMPTQSESPAPAAVSGTSQKMLQLLRKRLRQLVRVTLVLAICLAVAATALAIWWLTSLNGLPDIGDPFDVAAFRAFSVPDDQNAFTFLRRAEEKLTPSPSRGGAPPGLRSAIRSCGRGSRRIARRSNCFSRGPTNPTPRTRPEIPW